MEEKLLTLYSEEGVERLDPVNQRRRYFSCIKNPDDQIYYCKKDLYVKLNKGARLGYDFKNVSICKYIPERLVRFALSFTRRCKYIE
jgi:hypothetical protein